MRVRVTAQAFFLGRLRRAGEVIDIEDTVPLRRWMVRVCDTTPTRIITASDVLNAHIIERFGAVPQPRADVHDHTHADTEYDPINRNY